jgi:hypothetical protein
MQQFNDMNAIFTVNHPNSPLQNFVEAITKHTVHLGRENEA